MKKISELLKPFSSIVLGTLILLYFLNNLSMGGGYLAVGIIALILAIYYITIGIINFTLSRRMPRNVKKVFDTISLGAFPTFLFVVFLIILIYQNGQFGPAGWVLSIIYLVVSIGAALMLVLGSCIDNRGLRKASQLCGMIFALILVLDILFKETGAAIPLGELDLVLAFIYIIYGQMLFLSFVEAPLPAKKSAPAPDPAPTPEPVAPTPESPAPEVEPEEVAPEMEELKEE